MARTPCCSGGGGESGSLRRGPWTPEEDQKLSAYIQQHGHGNWRTLPQKAGLQRCGKSCRLRWINYLRPDIKRGKFSLQEEKLIIQLHALLGNRWSIIAAQLPNRTDNEIKNHWNTHLKKQLARMGIDPVTHKRKDHNNEDTSVAKISHIAQWESTRLEAEARLVRESMMHQQQNALRFLHSSMHSDALLRPSICSFSSLPQLHNQMANTLALPGVDDNFIHKKPSTSTMSAMELLTGFLGAFSAENIEAFINYNHKTFISANNLGFSNIIGLEASSEGCANFLPCDTDQDYLLSGGNYFTAADGSSEEEKSFWKVIF